MTARPGDTASGRPLRIGVVGVPGRWSTETLADALTARTGFRLVEDMAEVRADLSDKSLWAGGSNLNELDGLIVKKIGESYSAASLDRIELLRLAQRHGVRVFSRPETIARMLDRLACTMVLRLGDIAMPETVITESVCEALASVARFGTAVLKPLYSTKARGMVVLESQIEPSTLRQQVEAFKASNPVMYIQRKLDLAGRDYGMVFLGGEYLGTYARVGGSGAWNTTVNSGGRYVAHSPSAETLELGRRAQALFDMDFTTVDVADTSTGPVVFEVSAFGGFRGARDGLGIDAAALYADYAIAELTK